MWTLIPTRKSITHRGVNRCSDAMSCVRPDVQAASEWMFRCSESLIPYWTNAMRRSTGRAAPEEYPLHGCFRHTNVECFLRPEWISRCSESLISDWMMLWGAPQIVLLLDECPLHNCLRHINVECLLIAPQECRSRCLPRPVD